MLDLDIVKGYVLCKAEHCSLRSRKPKLYGEEILKADTLRLLQLRKNFIFLSRQISQTGPKFNRNTGELNNCLLYILKVLLNLHNFPLLNINCTEPYLGPLYISYIIVQILNCKIPERVLLNGATCERFSKVSRR